MSEYRSYEYVEVSSGTPMFGLDLVDQFEPDHYTAPMLTPTGPYPIPTPGGKPIIIVCYPWGLQLYKRKRRPPQANSSRTAIRSNEAF